MGNKSGIEVNQEQIKVVLALNTPELISFVEKELRTYIFTEFQFSKCKLFQLQSPLSKFLTEDSQ